MTGRDLRLDTTTAHPARRYNYWLGGKDHFAADRASGDAIERLYPGIINDARANRRFHCRAVEWLAAVQNVEQFLDVGCGIIPLGADTHDIAQTEHWNARVVYVDNDPLVLVHARALLTSHHAPEHVDYLDADLRMPDRILQGVAGTLNMSRPVALLLTAVLHFVPGTERPYNAVRALVDALPAGSFLVLSHASLELTPTEAQQKIEGTPLSEVPGAGQFTSRSKAEVAKFFDGLVFLDHDGVVPVDQWQPDFGTYPVLQSDRPAAVYGGVARKP